MVRERLVEKRLRSRVEELGLRCIKYADAEDGMPDRLILLPQSKVIWVELKTDGGRLSEIQKYQHKRLAAIGQDVRVVWSTEQAETLVEEIKEKHLST